MIAVEAMKGLQTFYEFWSTTFILFEPGLGNRKWKLEKLKKNEKRKLQRKSQESEAQSPNKKTLSSPDLNFQIYHKLKQIQSSKSRVIFRFIQLLHET